MLSDFDIPSIVTWWEIAQVIQAAGGIFGSVPQSRIKIPPAFDGQLFEQTEM